MDFLKGDTTESFETTKPEKKTEAPPTIDILGDNTHSQLDVFKQLNSGAKKNPPKKTEPKKAEPRKAEEFKLPDLDF